MVNKIFEKILVANRGEIALRVMRTLKNLGIKSVAVYSEADTNSLHVQYADEAYYIGPSPATESYLSIENIIKAVRKSGAAGVHPGYGFLSENYNFAKILKEEGVALIGPTPHSIRVMGDKIEAKKIAIESKVDTIPGYMGVIKDVKQAIEISKSIGFPVMIKAAAGGGGRGMRVVEREEGVAVAFESAKREAEIGFKDGRIFIEKFIINPRHIEIQVLADTFGNVVCLGERECSIQRHHQKIIEEAPSPFVDPETRRKMYDQVTALVKKIKYVSAGTVEFIMDKNKNFYFLEMNTRLQVEHCVTELVTGLDIVEQMIRIAAGEKLSIAQEDVKLTGWAIESRICAEDPSRGFLPSSGRITEYSEPIKSSHIRVDSGVKEGYEVSMYYDGMIAKLCSYADTREEAINYMKDGLGSYVIRGISHNISFLEAIMSNEKFIKGDISTQFIDSEYPGGFLGAELTSEITQIFLAVSMHMFMNEAKRNSNIGGQVHGRSRQISTRWVVNIDGVHYPIFIKASEQGYNIRHERNRIFVRSSWILGSNLFRGLVNEKPVTVRIEKCGVGYNLTYAGVTSKITVHTPRVSELEQFVPNSVAQDASGEIVAPLSGKIVLVKVNKDDEVKPGQELLIIEAMKMENVIYADRKAKVVDILVSHGDLVSANQLLIELEVE